MEHTYKRMFDTDPGAINLQMNRHVLELSQLCLEGLGEMCLKCALYGISLPSTRPVMWPPSLQFQWVPPGGSGA